MMWLVDFKLDFLSGENREALDKEAEPCKKKIKLCEDNESFSSHFDSYPSSPINLSYSNNETSNFNIQSQSQQSDDSESQPIECQPVQTRIISNAKPNYTYTDLITLALKDKTSLTVSAIYQWIT